MREKYYWRFTLIGEDGASHELGPNGDSQDSDVCFIGTQSEAFREGNHRAELWEEKFIGFLCKIECERMGKWTPRKLSTELTKHKQGQGGLF